MDVITLYSTGCPKCKILEQKLNSKRIPYRVIRNKELIMGMRIKEVPQLQIGHEYLNFNEANSWVNGI
ncbi:MAG: thioredoxin family protein [Candidatus Improbicoccus pseudotrichonymphae]|uniref:Thioredoxin family protein n=1 Tax=Candidatus Improbicoccus pseudotrichonymphae TaxID=3033792 RepID=A0AA48KVQ8_9FIRM|nr:MAG: thioredoxin family protein [Candidatus Improbicoccus pseudotrichonymphae]